MIVNWFKAPYLTGYLDTLVNGKTQIRINEKWGLIDENGNFIVECVGSHSFGFGMFTLIPIRNKKGKLGFMDSQKRMVVPHEYDEFHHYLDSFHLLKKDHYCVLVDSEGNIVKTEYKIRGLENIDFSDGLIGVEVWLNKNRDTACGYIDEEGKTVIPYVYDPRGSIDPFVNGFAPVSIADETSIYTWKTIFINKKNEIVFSCPENWGYACYDGEIGFVYIRDKNTYSFFDKNFNIVKDTTYDSVGFVNEFIHVHCSVKGKCTVLNRNLEELLPLEFDSVMALDDSNYLTVYNRYFRKNYKLPRKQHSFENVYILEGLYSISEQKLTVPLKYDSVKDVKNRLLGVRLGDKWGYVDYNDVLITPIMFDTIKIIVNNKAWVEFEGKWGIIELPTSDNLSLKSV